MTTEKRRRSNYTEDFKREAVALVTEQGYKISEAARSLDVGANLIGRWRCQFEEQASGARLSGDEKEELARLRKEVRQLRMEKEILKNRPRGTTAHRIETPLRYTVAVPGQWPLAFW